MCGLRNEQTQKRLLSDRNLTFDRAVDISVAVETATKDAVELEQCIDGAAIHKVQPRQNRRQYRKPCFSCVRNGHTPDECRFRDSQCQKCKQQGHTEPACQSNLGLYENNVTREEIHRAAALVGNTCVPNVHQYASSKIDSDENMSALEINSMNRSPDTNIMWLSPKVNGTPLRMELDTGSVVSVINKQQFDKYFPGKNTR